MIERSCAYVTTCLTVVVGCSPGAHGSFSPDGPVEAAPPPPPVPFPDPPPANPQVQVGPPPPPEATSFTQPHTGTLPSQRHTMGSSWIFEGPHHGPPFSTHSWPVRAIRLKGPHGSEWGWASHSCRAPTAEWGLNGGAINPSLCPHHDPSPCPLPPCRAHLQKGLLQSLLPAPPTCRQDGRASHFTFITGSSCLEQSTPSTHHPLWSGPLIRIKAGLEIWPCPPSCPSKCPSNCYFNCRPKCYSWAIH